MVESMLTRVRGQVRGRSGRTVVALAPVMILAGLLVAPRLVGLAPGTSIDPSTDDLTRSLNNPLVLPSSAAVALPPDAQRLLTDTVVLALDPDPAGNNEWLAGRLIGPWVRLGLSPADAIVRSDWGFVVATRPADGSVVVELIDPASAARTEIYRAEAAGGSTVQAALS
jgi:hypothetical protein